MRRFASQVQPTQSLFRGSLKLLKLGAQVRSSVRRIHFAIASGCPNKDEFELAYLFLQRAFSSA